MKMLLANWPGKCPAGLDSTIHIAASAYNFWIRKRSLIAKLFKLYLRTRVGSTLTLSETLQFGNDFS